ncbi:MAG: hypothetical protein ACJ788_16590, partial [Ktedonobacteraceae bacterium]
LATDGPTAKMIIAGYSLPAQVELVGGFVESVMRGDLGIEKQLADRRGAAQRLLELYIQNVK